MSVETEPTEIRNMILAVGGTVATWFAGVVGILALAYSWQFTVLMMILWSSLIYTIIALLSRRQTAALASWLEQVEFTDLYKLVVFKPFCLVWRGYASSPRANPGWWRCFRAALTHRVYDTALLIAVVYPLILLALPWLWSGAEVILSGEMVIREVTRFSSEHLLVLIPMAMFAAAAILKRTRHFEEKRFSLSDILFWTGLPILIGSLFLGWGRGNRVRSGRGSRFSKRSGCRNYRCSSCNRCVGSDAAFSCFARSIASRRCRCVCVGGSSNHRFFC